MSTMPALKEHAFGALMRCRSWAQRAGADEIARNHPRLQSICRTLYRPLYGLLQPEGMIVANLHGIKISADARNRELGRILLGDGCWEPAQTEFFESILREGSVFVDVGAHIGYYALLGARRVLHTGRVYAFEPAPETFRALVRNIAQNSLSNVTAEQVAVSRASGQATLTLSESDSASHSLAQSPHGGRRIEVRTISLDEYFAGRETRIDVIKMDAEGAELAILEGMQQTLARNPDLVLFTELYPQAMEAFGTSPVAYLDQLREAGFTLYPFSESGAAERPLDPGGFRKFVDDLRIKATATNLLCRRERRARPSRYFPMPGKASDAHPHGSDDSKPWLSVAIPTYNRSTLLQGTLESILPQLRDGVEVVVYDTGSTDSTCERMDRVASRDPSVRFYRNPERRSLDEALLDLLTLSRGKYIWFFSSDDRMAPGAVDAVRRRILAAAQPPALVYVNQTITDEFGKTLIASQVGRDRDRNFADGRRIVPWLGLNLGFISASVICRESALRISSARGFIGTRSVNLHLYLSCLLAGGPALYVAEPLVRARRTFGHPPYDYSEVFVRGIVRIYEDARQRGFGRVSIYKTMQRIVAGQYLRLVVSWRADDPDELARALPVMLRACWMYLPFWLLIVPTRFAPRWLVANVRNLLRRRRATRTRGKRNDPAQFLPNSTVWLP